MKKSEEMVKKMYFICQDCLGRATYLHDRNIKTQKCFGHFNKGI